MVRLELVEARYGFLEDRSYCRVGLQAAHCADVVRFLRVAQSPPDSHEDEDESSVSQAWYQRARRWENWYHSWRLCSFWQKRWPY